MGPAPHCVARPTSCESSSSRSSAAAGSARRAFLSCVARGVKHRRHGAPARVCRYRWCGFRLACDKNRLPRSDFWLWPSCPWLRAAYFWLPAPCGGLRSPYRWFTGSGRGLPRFACWFECGGRRLVFVDRAYRLAGRRLVRSCPWSASRCSRFTMAWRRFALPWRGLARVYRWFASPCFWLAAAGFRLVPAGRGLLLPWRRFEPGGRAACSRNDESAITA